MISLLLTYLKRDIQREASVPSRRKTRVTWKGLFSQSLSEKEPSKKCPETRKQALPSSRGETLLGPFPRIHLSVAWFFSSNHAWPSSHHIFIRSHLSAQKSAKQPLDVPPKAAGLDCSNSLCLSSTCVPESLSWLLCPAEQISRALCVAFPS